MLSELNMVGNWFKAEPDSSWLFDELKFDESDKFIFESLELDIKVYDHSAVVGSSINNNHCYIPSQYFLYAIKLSPLISLVNKYIEYFDQVVQALPNSDAVGDFIVNRNAHPPEMNDIDSYSLGKFYDVFDVSNADGRLKAKEIINGYGKTSDTKIRPYSDFLRSVILKSLPVPDNSSDALSKLVCAFSNSPLAQQTLVSNYSAYLPHLFHSAEGDELLLMVLSTLGWRDILDSVIGTSTSRYCDWSGITGAFLLSLTPVPGNTLYVEQPIHYSKILQKYIHIKKGLLDTEESIETVSKLISALWPDMCIHKSNGEFFFKSSNRSNISGPIFHGATNKIFYGAPGTGKSHKILTEECLNAKKIVTVFHPDTQYNDFVGALKPMMKKNGDGNSIVSYQFRPGPFTNALIKAKVLPSTHVCLVIEEINRAPASAVFGELFQLLDRNDSGESTYKIDAADLDMLMYINEQLRTAGISEITQLEIPANLSILATMNSSDQAVMPLDTAFKRRWNFEYVKIDFTNPKVPKTVIDIQTKNGRFSIIWPELAKIFNDLLIDAGVTEDRLIGPFFLAPKELNNSKSTTLALNGKLFVYLWDDVLRHLGHTKLFSQRYKTFGGLSDAFNKGKPIFNSVIENKIEEKGVKTDVVEASQNATQ